MADRRETEVLVDAQSPAPASPNARHAGRDIARQHADFVMALAARPYPATWMVGIVIAVVAMGALIYLLLRVGAPLAKRMGPGALAAIDRILGFLILAIAIELIITGIQGAYPAFGI